MTSLRVWSIAIRGNATLLRSEVQDSIIDVGSVSRYLNIIVE